MTATSPQIGAMMVIAGKMNRKGNPKVQTFFRGFAMCTKNTIVISKSNEKVSEKKINHFCRLPAPGGLPWFFNKRSQIE